MEHPEKNYQEDTKDPIESAKKEFRAACQAVQEAEQKAFDRNVPSNDLGAISALTNAKTRKRNAHNTLLQLGMSEDAIRDLM